MFLASALFLWIVCASSLAGALCLKPLRIAWTSGAQAFAFSAALGLGLWCLALYWAGWLIAYTPGMAIAVTSLFSTAALVYAWARLREGLSLPKFSGAFAIRDIRLLLGLLCFACVAVNFVGSFAPVVDRADVLAYHLNLPKEWIRAGKIAVFPYDVNSAFPLLVNAGYGVALLFGHPALANLLALWMGVLTAVGIYGWALEKSSARCAWLAAACFLLTPALTNHINTPYVDIPLALFAMLAFWSFTAWTQSGRAVWIAAGGIFCGFALGVKYLAVIYAGLLAVSIILQCLRNKTGVAACLKLLMIFIFVAIAVAFVWYARSYAAMGNPVYPYFSKYLGGKPSLIGWDLVRSNIGRGHGAWDLIKFFWDATYYPLAYGGFGTRWNLLYLGLLPMVVWQTLRQRGNWVAFFALAVLLSWFGTYQVMRYLIPFLPLYCVLIAWSFASVKRGKALWIWVAAVCLWETGTAAVHALPSMRVAVHPGVRNQYLMANESTWGIARWVNANLPPSSKILSDGEIRFFYFDPAMIREPVLRLFSPYPKAMHSPQEAITFLKEQGFTHVLIREDASFDGHPLALCKLVENAAWFKLLHEEHGVWRNAAIRYRVYAIL